MGTQARTSHLGFTGCYVDTFNPPPAGGEVKHCPHIGAQPPKSDAVQKDKLELSC
jgi:hypothetical protein